MKRTLLALAAVIWAPYAQAQRRAELTAEALLNAIAAVESGNNPHAIGRKGERGRCQFKEKTWRKYTSAPFLLWAPIDCEFTRKIERAHLSYLLGYFRQRGTPFDPTLIAAAWHFGEGHALANIRDDAAVRVANLYYDAVARRASR